jgi:hypothetical protein
MHMKRYLRQFAVAAAAVLLGIVALNVLVDPHHVFRVLSPPTWESVKVRATERTSKAEIARSGRADVLLVGDSRVMIGINPDHPALQSYGDAYNFAFASGTVYEAMRIVELARAARPPRLVVWGMDPHGMTSLCSAQSNYDFASTPLNPDLNAYEYYRLHLIGLHETRESIGVLRRALCKSTDAPIRRGQLTRLAPFEGDHAHRFAQLLSSQVGDAGQPGSLPDTGVPRLSRCLEQLQAGGTRVVLFFPPVHATRQELFFRNSVNRRHAEVCLRELIASVQHLNLVHPDRPAVEVWDFRGFTAYHTEPIPDSNRASMQWYWEAVHFRQELGDLVLARIFEGREGDDGFGVILSEENLERHLARLLRQREDYVREHRDQVRVVSTAQRIAAQAAR